MSNSNTLRVAKTEISYEHSLNIRVTELLCFGRLNLKIRQKVFSEKKLDVVINACD